MSVDGSGSVSVSTIASTSNKSRNGKIGNLSSGAAGGGSYCWVERLADAIVAELFTYLDLTTHIAMMKASSSLNRISSTLPRSRSTPFALPLPATSDVKEVVNQLKWYMEHHWSIGALTIHCDPNDSYEMLTTLKSIKHLSRLTFTRLPITDSNYSTYRGPAAHVLMELSSSLTSLSLPPYTILQPTALRSLVKFKQLHELSSPSMGNWLYLQMCPSSLTSLSMPGLLFSGTLAEAEALNRLTNLTHMECAYSPQDSILHMLGSSACHKIHYPNKLPPISSLHLRPTYHRGGMPHCSPSPKLTSVYTPLMSLIMDVPILGEACVNLTKTLPSLHRLHLEVHDSTPTEIGTLIELKHLTHLILKIVGHRGTAVLFNASLLPLRSCLRGLTLTNVTTVGTSTPVIASNVYQFTNLTSLDLSGDIIKSLSMSHCMSILPITLMDLRLSLFEYVPNHLAAIQRLANLTCLQFHEEGHHSASVALQVDLTSPLIALTWPRLVQGRLRLQGEDVYNFVPNAIRLFPYDLLDGYSLYVQKCPDSLIECAPFISSFTRDGGVLPWTTRLPYGDGSARLAEAWTQLGVQVVYFN
jgi:hypothetical protein